MRLRRVAVSMTYPPDLLAAIDARAKRERGDRTGLVMRVLSLAAEQWAREDAALEAPADVQAAERAGE